MFYSYEDNVANGDVARYEINSETTAINNYSLDCARLIITWRGLRTDIVSIFEMFSHAASVIRKAPFLVRGGSFL